jgi:putative ABC transport system permease protein
LATNQLSTNNIEAISGERSAQFEFGKDTSEGIRGFYYAPSGGQVPVIINQPLSSATGLQLSDSLLVTINGQVIPVKVINVINNFPTLSSDRGFLIADLDLLLRYVKLKSATSVSGANEVFLTVDEGHNTDVVNSLHSILGRASPVRVYDGEANLASAQLDPLVSGGWKSMVVVAVFVVIFTGALGYSTYLLSFTKRMKIQMASLRTLGLSKLQVAGLLYLENIVIFAMGIGLGTWAGFQMSNLMVDSVAITETGSKVMPVFQIVTNWQIMLPVYGILVIIFVTAVLFMYRSVIKVDLPSMSRRVIN